MNAKVSPPPPVLAGCATLFQSIPVPWFDDTSTPNARVPLGFVTLARNHSDSEFPGVKSMVGLGFTSALFVESRSHCDVEPSGTNDHRAATDWLPVCATVLTSVELSP